jgi:hypothetical protein
MAAADSPGRQLERFLAKYTPEVAAVAKAGLAKMRKRLPGAVELVYDNYNALVIGFGPTERSSDAVFSIAVYPRWVNLFFLQGAKLADPQKLLKGGGKQVRSIVLEDATVLDEPPVRTLISRALEAAARPIDGSARRRIVIKSISAKQRPRRPGATR